MRGGVGPVSPLRIYLVQEAASVDIPHLDAPPPITRKYLSLVRMKGDGVDGMAGVKGTGGGRTAKVIKLDGAIFRAAVQVSAVAMETQAGHRRPVSLEGQNRPPPPPLAAASEADGVPTPAPPPPPPAMEYSRMVGLPAAARNCLSGVISSLFTCESGWRMILEHMPDGASQNRILWSYPAVARMTLITLAAGSCK